MPQKAAVMVPLYLMPKMTTTALVLVHEVTWPTKYNVTSTEILQSIHTQDYILISWNLTLITFPAYKTWALFRLPAAFRFYKFRLYCFTSDTINAVPARLLHAHLCFCTLNEFNSYCDSLRPRPNVCCSLPSTSPSWLHGISAFQPLITADTLSIFLNLLFSVLSLPLFSVSVLSHQWFITLRPPPLAPKW